MYEEISKYYDDIYSNKDYTKESNNILISCDRLDVPKTSILDIGCGTGSHLKFLEQHFTRSVGVDMSDGMILKAKKNLKSSTLHVGTVEDIRDTGFDVIISMFNVVNHILTLKDLMSYFKTCSDKISKGGLLMFDSFNGNEVIIDHPIDKTYNNNGFSVYTKPSVDTFNSSFEMVNEITKGGESIINYTLQHILWPYKIYEDLLKMNGFRVVEVVKGYKILVTAIKI